jgi:hypothetical protein
MIGRLVQKEDRGGNEQGPGQGHSHAPPATHVFAFLVDCGTAFAMWKKGEMEIEKDGKKARRISLTTDGFPFFKDSWKLCHWTY